MNHADRLRFQIDADRQDFVEIEEVPPFPEFGDATPIGVSRKQHIPLPEGEITFAANYIVNRDPIRVGQGFVVNGRKVGEVFEVKRTPIDGAVQWDLRIRVTNPKASRQWSRPQAKRRLATLERNPHHRSRGMRRHIRRVKAAERRLA